MILLCVWGGDTQVREIGGIGEREGGRDRIGNLKYLT